VSAVCGSDDGGTDCGCDAVVIGWSDLTARKLLCFYFVLFLLFCFFFISIWLFLVLMVTVGGRR
jgi:hypothetical protein